MSTRTTFLLSRMWSLLRGLTVSIYRSLDSVVCLHIVVYFQK